MSPESIEPARPWDRRKWMAACGAAFVATAVGRGRAVGADGPPQGPPVDPEAELAAIRERAGMLGIGPLRTSRSEHYRGIGTADADFLQKAVTLCEGLAIDYMKHFRDRGFELTAPATRLCLVALADHDSFARYLGGNPGPDVGGVYELDTNHLVLFDNRGTAAGNPEALRQNSIALFHEAMHQLTFNTGPLDRRREVPLVVSEGLAMYGEVRRPDGRTPIGRVNRERLGVIARGARDGTPWIAVDRLFDDAVFDPGPTVQMAYAESWLLTHALLSGERTAGRYRSYLAALRARTAATGRVDEAREHLGPLDRLDADLRAYANRLIRA